MGPVFLLHILQFLLVACQIAAHITKIAMEMATQAGRRANTRIGACIPRSEPLPP